MESGSGAKANRGIGAGCRQAVVFIGAQPGTGRLAGQLAEDTHGLLVTGTNVPLTAGVRESGAVVPGGQPAGMFAVGSGSAKRAAVAMGEGSTAVWVAFDRLRASGQVDAVGPGASEPGGARR
jgi:hypothetical protein